MPEKIVAMHAAYKSGKEVVDGFLARPGASEARNAIVLIHGYRGLDDGQRAVTRKFAREGFLCLSPDLFHGNVLNTPEDCAFHKTSLDIPRAVEKIVDSVPYLRRLPYVGDKKIAVLGFCMGGGLALYVLGRSRLFAGGVIYYQSLFPDPEELQGIRAPLLCHYGTADSNTTKTEIEMFKSALDRYRKKYEIHMYQGAGHAFLNNPQGKSEANRKAAEESVVKTCQWLKKVFA
ncbi:MAG: dienelactone hydrolase family protein [Deltaproteobacteria bacterium]|nr:dienelactone hydrolase family protein [Deltaproteobacteria bacterium]